MCNEGWADKGLHCFGMLMDGRAQSTGIRHRGTEATLLLILNAHHDLVEFRFATQGDRSSWRLLIDTNIPDESNAPVFDSGTSYGVTGRSLLLFELTV
jgi:isoamylase